MRPTDDQPAASSSTGPRDSDKTGKHHPLREQAIRCVFLDEAHDNLGIYPQSVSGGENPYKKRTEWMNGWNAAVMALTTNVGTLENWRDSLPTEVKPLVEDALLAKRLSLSVRTAGVSLFVNCSDTFFWGCSDAEEISFAELPALAECYRLSPTHGGELWCARKRGMRPQTASYEECYPPAEWSLFDAAGPERDDPDGKRRPDPTRARKVVSGRAIPV